MNIGVNFFGPKRKLYHDFEGTLRQLKDAGINSAEICVTFWENSTPPEVFSEMTGGIWSYHTASENVQRVRKNGLTIVSCHIMLGNPEDTKLEDLQKMLPDLRKFAKENNIKYYVLSLMKGLDGIIPFVPVLNEICQALEEDGVTLCYHNHEMECLPENSTTALDLILKQCPLLKLELDVGWAKFSGTDPIAWMKKYHDRMVLLHFKDIRADASPATRNTCFTAVGEGSIPLSAILKAAKDCPLDPYGLIIDQDDSESDILEDLARGVQNINRSVTSLQAQ